MRRFRSRQGNTQNRAIGSKLAEQAVLIKADGDVHDLRAPLADGQKIQILTTRDSNDPDALYVLRHSSAHLLAEAVRRLYPGVKIAIGPPIENGFYYDFARERPFTPEDLERIEAKMREIVAANQPFEFQETTRDEARRRFEAAGERYKLHFLSMIPEGAKVTYYKNGPFLDLCRGPHLKSTGELGAFKLTHVAGAYWLGNDYLGIGPSAVSTVGMQRWQNVCDYRA